MYYTVQYVLPYKLKCLHWKIFAKYILQQHFKSDSLSDIVKIRNHINNIPIDDDTTNEPDIEKTKKKMISSSRQRTSI